MLRARLTDGRPRAGAKHEFTLGKVGAPCRTAIVSIYLCWISTLNHGRHSTLKSVRVSSSKNGLRSRLRRMRLLPLIPEALPMRWTMPYDDLVGDDVEILPHVLGLGSSVKDVVVDALNQSGFPTSRRWSPKCGRRPGTVPSLPWRAQGLPTGEIKWPRMRPP
jgi:hypothetical protein